MNMPSNMSSTPKTDLVEFFKSRFLKVPKDFCLLQHIVSHCMGPQRLLQYTVSNCVGPQRLLQHTVYHTVWYHNDFWDIRVSHKSLFQIPKSRPTLVRAINNNSTNLGLHTYTYLYKHPLDYGESLRRPTSRPTTRS